MPLVSGRRRNKTIVANADEAPNNPNTPAMPILVFIIGYSLVKPNKTALNRQKMYPPHKPRTFVGRSSPIINPGSKKNPNVLNAT